MDTPNVGVNILIIDDNIITSSILEHLLSNEGFNTTVANNGLDGRLIAESINPDIILLDIIMPGENGLETCRHLHECHLTSHIPIIFITSVQEIGCKLDGFSAGAVDYIIKPFDRSEVLARIQAHLRQSRAHRLLIQSHITERRQVEREKLRFYHDTIKSVTEGKLNLVSFEEIKEYLDHAGFICNVGSHADCASARSKTIDFCLSSGLSDQKHELFELAIGEAITNAIRHADGCRVYAGIGDDSIWVAISDTGQGISTMLLPSATLRRGFSSKVSMGMGYTIIMDGTDNIMLCTGFKGTTVVLSVNLKSEPAMDNFPYIWAKITDV